VVDDLAFSRLAGLDDMNGDSLWFSIAERIQQSESTFVNWIAALACH
jgi:hypothetical protein